MYITITDISYFLIHAGLELNVRNVLNVLRKAGFADADWAELGLQLIDQFDLSTIKVDHGQAGLCMIETISQWLKMDCEASWEKLTDAIPEVGGYGEAIAANVREKAGIPPTCMFYVRRSVSILCKVPIHWEKFDCSHFFFDCRHSSDSRETKSFFSVNFYSGQTE